jgi:hypothetical protein
MNAGFIFFVFLSKRVKKWGKRGIPGLEQTFFQRKPR